MTEIECPKLDSGYLTDEEQHKLKVAFNTVLEEIDLKNEFKKILVTYNLDKSVINENNRAKIICNEDELKNREASFETLKKYIFINNTVYIELIRHELMHLKDMSDLKFKFSHKKEPKVGTRLYKVVIFVWNIYIDSRLKVVYGLESSRDKDYRKGEFLAIVNDENWFECLWKKRDITYDYLIEEAKKILKKLP